MSAKRSDLHAEELIPAGGEWWGLLFDNPAAGYDLGLTWTFRFDYLPVHRDYGESTPSVEFDWVPFEVSGWAAMVGLQVEASRFAEPIETSLYFFEHFRFDQAAIRVLDHRGSEIRVAGTTRGDLDRLGLDQLEVDQWLGFAGVVVQPSVPPGDVEAAERLLAQYTDTSDLVGVARGHNYLFKPTT